jgi:hypothetical protein
MNMLLNAQREFFARSLEIRAATQPAAAPDVPQAQP